MCCLVHFGSAGFFRLVRKSAPGPSSSSLAGSGPARLGSWKVEPVELSGVSRAGHLGPLGFSEARIANTPGSGIGGGADVVVLGSGEVLIRLLASTRRHLDALISYGKIIL